MNTLDKIIITYILVLAVNTVIAEADTASTISNDTTGEIDHYIFYRSVPDKMSIGEPYTVNVFVRNTGDTTNTFRVVLAAYDANQASKVLSGGMFPSGEFIYPRYESSIIVLRKGESRRLKFNIVPVKPKIGYLEVSADLYLVKSKQFLPSDLILLDSTSKQVHDIEPAFTKEEQLLINVIMITIFTAVFITIFIRRNQRRN